MVQLEAYDIVDDKLVVITGGEEAHIGSASLAEDTHEVLSICKKGHMDHIISEKMARLIYDKIEKDVLVVCGIHIDYATTEEIEQLVENARQCVTIYLKEKK
jgi:hypothetical protein